MNWIIVRTLMFHEVRMLIRDRRSVILSVFLPIVIIPAMLLGTRVVGEWRTEKLDDTVYRYAVTGPGAESVREVIKRARIYLKDHGADEADRDLLTFRAEELPAAEPDTLMKSRDLHFYLEGLPGDTPDSLAGVTSTAKFDSLAGNTGPLGSITDVRFPGVPVINIYFLANRDASNEGSRKMWRLLRLIREEDRAAALRDHGLAVPPQNIVQIDQNNVATASQMSGSMLGQFLPMVLVFLMLTGGSVAAMDSIAGEKERGSLETLLTTCVSRMEIVAAKQLTILIVALVITFIQILNLLCYVTFEVIQLPEDFTISLSPKTLLFILALFIPVAAFISSVLLMISAYAKSFKETQFYFLPVFLTISVLMASSLLPGLSLNSIIAFVPLANVSVAVREIMVGNYNWPMLAITLIVMLGAAVVSARASANMLSMERLISAGDMDEADLAGGPTLFPRHVLRWYAVLWAVMFAVAVNMEVENAFYTQLFINEFVLFLGVPFLIIWRYRLKVKEALALRPVKPIVWPLILLLIPATQLTGTAVFFIANLIFPVPEKMLEEFGRNILPENLATWQLLFLIGIVPGICEEIGFRGTLLHGLRRKFHPVVLVLVVGGIFGLYHMALFRIIPTGFLGVIITAVALMTGSILPCMLLHAGNNMFAVIMTRLAVPIAGLDWWYYGLAAITFVGCLILLYRNRTPYPGLRN